MKPDISSFSKPNPALAECVNLPEAFYDALNVSATDLVQASRVAREEAVRYRSIGMFPVAKEVVGISILTLDGRIGANDIYVSPLEYSHLNKELVGTLMLQADLAAVDGDYSTVRDSLEAAKRANYRTEPDEREDLSDQSRAILQTVIENGSLFARVRARRALKAVPESTKSLEVRMNALDRNIQDARRQWDWDRLPNYRIAEEWLKWGDAHSIDQARLLALYRNTEDTSSDHFSLDEDSQRVHILYLCARQGSVDAAHDLLQHVKKSFAENPDSHKYATDLVDALLAGLFVDDKDVINETLQIARDLLSQPEERRLGLRYIELAEPQILAGERDPYKIDGLFKEVCIGNDTYQDCSYITLGLLDKPPRVKAPQY